MCKSEIIAVVLLLVAFSKKSSAQDDVFTIFTKKCIVCHQANNVAKFTNINEVLANKKTLVHVIENNIMPPWPPDNSYQQYKHNRGLSTQEKNSLLEWLKNAQSTAMEKEKKASSEKAAIVNVSVEIKNISLPVNESDTTYVFDIPYHANENMDVGQIVFRSSALDKIHHCNYFFVPNDAKDFSFNNMIYAGGYSPGNMQYPFAYGTGFRLPKNGHIRGELHVPPLSKAIDFSIYFSLYKSIKPISETLYLIPLANLKPDNTTTFFIPADTLITFTGHTKLMEDATLCNVNPHMHLLGKSVTAFAITPANDTVPLINIPKWNFNWQDFYEFEQPIFLPKNSTIVLQMTYDNTTQNPSNPNRPPVLITEGWYTSQEMFTLLLIAKKKNL